MTSNDVALPRADKGKREARQRGRRPVMMGRRAGKTMRYYLRNLRGQLVQKEKSQEITQVFFGFFLASVCAHCIAFQSNTEVS